MSVHGYFSTPIYDNTLVGAELVAVQEELDQVVADLKSKDSFKFFEYFILALKSFKNILFYVFDFLLNTL